MRMPPFPGLAKAVRDALILGGIGVGVLILAACAAAPEIRYFRVEYPLPSPSANSPLPLTLAIAHLSAAEPYHQERIIYQDSPYQVQYYARDRWESPPVQMVNDRLLEQFTASERFQRVVPWHRGETPAYLLQTRLRRFEELDEGDAWYGLVELEYELLDRDGRSLLRQVASQRMRTESRNPEGTVAALSRGLRAVLDEVLTKTVAALKDAQP
jgi:ABC-type uncharacterized transport system auxiliary subunit